MAMAGGNWQMYQGQMVPPSGPPPTPPRSTSEHWVQMLKKVPQASPHAMSFPVATDVGNHHLRVSNDHYSDSIVLDCPRCRKKWKIGKVMLHRESARYIDPKVLIRDIVGVCQLLEARIAADLTLFLQRHGPVSDRELDFFSDSHRYFRDEVIVLAFKLGFNHSPYYALPSDHPLAKGGQSPRGAGGHLWEVEDGHVNDKEEKREATDDVRRDSGYSGSTHVSDPDRERRPAGPAYPAIYGGHGSHFHASYLAASADYQRSVNKALESYRFAARPHRKVAGENHQKAEKDVAAPGHSGGSDQPRRSHLRRLWERLVP